MPAASREAAPAIAWTGTPPGPFGLLLLRLPRRAAALLPEAARRLSGQRAAWWCTIAAGARARNPCGS
jgi:hypothetical protein